MAHDIYDQMIQLAVDGLLAEEEEARLYQHVQTCSSCADVWEKVALVDSLLKAQTELSPPPDFRANVMARVSAYEVQRRRHPWFLGILTVIFLAATFSVTAPLLFFSSGIYKIVFGWPIVGTVVGYGAKTYAFVVDSGTLLLSILIDWLTFLAHDPVSLAVVLVALILASTWIGLLEVSKHMPPAILASQSV